MESSHVPLTKWALGYHKKAASKKSISAKQMQRELNLGSYRTAWFLTMRIREAMKLPKIQMGRPIGGTENALSERTDKWPTREERVASYKEAREELSKGMKTTVKDLTKRDGTLYSFASATLLAYAMALIDKKALEVPRHF